MIKSRAFSRKRNLGFTLVELLVVIAIIGILIGMLLPAVQQVRESARRTVCANNMRQIGIGLYNYQSNFQEFPPGFTLNDPVNSGIGTFGWLCFTLPYLDQGNLFDTINPLDQTQALSNAPDQGGAIIPSFVCPSSELPEQSSEGFAKCNYVGNQGFGNSRIFDDGGIFDDDVRYNLSDITDGASNTIMFGEADGSLVEIDEENDNAFPKWIGATPLDGDFQVSFARRSVLRRGDAIRGFNQPNTSGDAMPGDFDPALFSSRHPSGADFGMSDGSVRFISETIDTGTFLVTRTSLPPDGTYMKLIIRNDGQSVGAF